VSQAPVYETHAGSRHTTISIVSMHGRRSRKTGVHILRSIGVCPTEVIDQRAALFEGRAVLCIILVNIEPEKRRINRGGRMQRLQGTKMVRGTLASTSSEGLRTLTSTRLVRRSSAASQRGSGGGSSSDRSSSRSRAMSFAEADDR